MPDKITPCLWFDGQAEEAAQFYTSVFANSRILGVARYGEAGPGEPGTAMTVEWELDGQRYLGLNGGPMYEFTEATSFQVHCDDQAEIDYYWERLSDGGEQRPCGWLKDRYGLSWQVIPRGIGELIADPRAMKAMLGMRKLDIEELRRAASGAPAA